MTDDLIMLKEAQDHGQQLKGVYSQRNKMYDEMERIFLMDWTDEERVKNVMQGVKITKSPDARNALLGAHRLMIATEPQFSIPNELNTPQVMQTASKIERAASAMWRAAGRCKRKPVQYDVVLSLLLFGEVYISVTRAADLVASASKSSKAAQLHAEELAALAPYLFDVWDARTCYPEVGPYGMSALYREVETTVGQVRDEFGEAAQDLSGARVDAVTLCHYWNHTHRFTWVDGMNQALVAEEHGLPFIPVVHQVGEGSQLFSDPEDQVTPFLYTVWQSGLWDRQNLSLTVYYTMLFALGANPLYFERVSVNGRHLEVDRSVPGGVVTLLPGEEYGQIPNRPVDPTILEGMSIANQKMQESTIYGQTLGAPVGGGNAAYSMVALLHQAGRLPLVTPQQAGGFAIADAVKMALRWMRIEPSGYMGANESLAIRTGDIPAQFELECRLDVALPQDNLQAANIASLLIKAGVASTRWVQENVLKIGQPEQMQKEIWTEQAAGAMFGMYIQDQIQAMQRNAAAAAGTGEMGGGIPQGGPPPMGQAMPPGYGPETGGAPVGLPPEMMGQAGPVMPGDEGMME